MTSVDPIANISAVLGELSVGESRFINATQSQRDAGYKFLNGIIENLTDTTGARFGQQIVNQGGQRGVLVPALPEQKKRSHLSPTCGRFGRQSPCAA